MRVGPVRVGPARVGRRRAAGGYALVLALVVLLVTAAAASLLAAALSLELRLASRETSSVRLTALADGAAAEALAQLAHNQGFAGSEPRALGDGVISSRVERLTAARRRVIATATRGGRSRSVTIDVEITASGPVVVRWRRESGRRP